MPHHDAFGADVVLGDAASIAEPISGAPEDPTPIEDRVDGYARKAEHADQRKVYMWTFSHTGRPDRARPMDFDRRAFARVVLDAYQAGGKCVEQWAVFQETHPMSKSALEQTLHFHMVVQTSRPARWLEMANHMREHANVFASAASSSSRQSYWSAFSYLFAPTARKPKEDLDGEYVLSPDHPDLPQKLMTKREGVRRLQPLEVFSTIVAQRLDTIMKVFGFAARQLAAGDPAWVSHCMKHPPQKLKQAISSALGISSADESLKRAALSHYDVLRAAQTHACICGGRAVPGWELILVLNKIDITAYRASLLAAFQGGGGKGLNHLYIGAPSTGKTALTRPILALFDTFAFVKPQKDTTFALEGLIGAQVVVWNDFRWPLPPLSWGDLLNMLDNEPFRVAVPKVDGAKDYHWNREGKEDVLCVLTSNVPVVHISGGAVNIVETAAWNERFGANTYTFNAPLPNKDTRFKQWGKCTRCYADWVCAMAPHSSANVVAPSAPERPGKRRRTSAAALEAATSAAASEGVILPLRPGRTAGRGHAPAPTPDLAAPSAETAEPVRDLNALVLRRGGMVEYTESLTAKTGPWLCSVLALGVTACGEGLTKKEAKRTAARAALQSLA